MGFWAERVLPRLIDASLGSRHVSALRREALAEASGKVLEIGFGSGLNLPHYPESVVEIVAIDPSPGMRDRARERIAASRVKVHFELLGGESLPFADETFDTVACTFTLCSIDGVEAALLEVRRVLRSGGLFLFVEHGLSPDPGVQRFQRWLNPLQWQFGGGCQLVRDPVALVEGAGLTVEHRRAEYLPDGPRTHTWVTLGRARR